MFIVSQSYIELHMIKSFRSQFDHEFLSHEMIQEWRCPHIIFVIMPERIHYPAKPYINHVYGMLQRKSISPQFLSYDRKYDSFILP